MAVHLHVAAGVAEIVLDRPDKLNAFDDTMVTEMHTAIDGVGEARAVIVHGEGRAFCAGHDLAGADPGNEDGERCSPTS